MSTPLPRVLYVIFIHLGVVANVQMHTRPALELVIAGQELVLICSVDGVPGPVRIFWYKKSNKKPMKAKIQNSLNEEFKITMVKKRDAGEYYCEANNGRLSFRSKSVTINVKGASARYYLRNGLLNLVKTTR